MSMLSPCLHAREQSLRIHNLNWEKEEVHIFNTPPKINMEPKKDGF